MKCLVTGGAGFIGSHLVDELIKLNYEVVVIDNESAESNSYFFYNGAARYYKLDVADYESTRSLYNDIDYVFHLAAESKIQPTVLNPILAFRTNTLGTQIVLQCSKEAGIKRLIYSSTSASYGLKNDMPLSEDMPNDCLTPYAVSKIAGEEICKMYTKLYSLPTTILRYFNVYGDRQPTKGVYAPVVGLFLKQYAADKPLTIVGDGMQRRDFTHIYDVVRANIMCISQNQNLNAATINIGSGINSSILDLAKNISTEYVFIAQRKGESIQTLADISRAKILLG